MALLSKQQIQSAPKRKYMILEVPEWGGQVRLQSLTGKERDDFESSLSTTRGNKTKENKANFRGRLAALVIVDEDGHRLFNNHLEIEALGDGSVGGLQRVFNAAQSMNAFTDEDVDGLTEDFEEAPDEPSTSA